MNSLPSGLIFMACAALFFSGCGVAYQSTSIKSGLSDGMKVRVVSVTPETVLAANQAPYQPKTLPAFYAAAGVPSPVLSPEARPAAGAGQIVLPPPSPALPYRIGVGDVVLLATKKSQPSTVEQLSGLLAAENSRQGYTVQDDGAIAIPEAGRVRLVGLTLEEAENAVFKRLLERQIDPSFSLEIAEFNAHRVTIGGSVAKPGVAPITLTPLTLDAALAQAGGIDTADRKTAMIRIYRNGAVYQLPVTAFLASPNYQKLKLVDGDSVFVDSDFSSQRAADYFDQQVAVLQAGQNAAQIGSARQQEFDTRLQLGAVKRDYIFLAGEVQRPGRWPLPFEHKASLADGLYAQGGVMAASGNPRQIYVLRGSSDPREMGSLTAWHIDAGTAAGLLLQTRFELRPDDVIYVAEQPVTKWYRTISQITPSLISVPLDNATAP